MKFKTCQVLNDHFSLDEKYAPYFIGKKDKKVYVSDGLEKGYIYASLYFYDEVKKEVDKLEKMIRKTHEEVLMDAPDADPAIMMIELSRRVKDAIGDDSLDAFIKEILAEQAKHISLLPDRTEIEKYENIRESILTELITTFYDITIHKAVDEGKYKTVTLSQKYVDAMTERQRKLFSPAMRMVGFLNDLRLEEFKVKPDFEIFFVPGKLNKPFAAQEEIIKENIKKLMAENS